MYVGRKAADLALLNGRGDAACSWLLRHSQSDVARWERPTIKSSTTAAETIKMMLSTGGSQCWAAAVGLYTEALATHSILQCGVIAHRERHIVIARILSAITDSGAISASHVLLAQRMARDITLPLDGASLDEWRAMSEACRSIFFVLLETKEFEAIQSCTLHWWRGGAPPSVVRQVLLILIVTSARKGGDMECCAALLHFGFFRHLGNTMGMSPFEVLLSLLAERSGDDDNTVEDGGEVDRCVARWCVDVALHMHANPWTLLCTHFQRSYGLSNLFYQEFLECCCTYHRLPMPSSVVDFLPKSVLCESIEDVLRCCWDHKRGNSSSLDLTESTLQLLRDAVSAAVSSPKLQEEAIVCLDLFSHLCSGSALPHDNVWWCDHIQRCRPATVESAMLWTALCDRMGLGDLLFHSLPALPVSLPLLVIQASRSTSSAMALFTAVQRSDLSSSDVLNIPWIAARNVLLLCRDNDQSAAAGAAVAVDWVLRHCRDREGLAQFVVDYLREYRGVASVVLRALLEQPEHADILQLLSRLLEGRSRACMERVICLAPQNERWVMALRCLSKMTAPSIGHLHTAFVALVEHLDKPFSLSVDFLWSDSTLTSLQAKVSSALWRVTGDRWEAALRIVSMGAERMRHRPVLLRRYAHALLRTVGLNSLVRAEVDAFLTRLYTTTSGSSILPSSREKLLALVRRRQWIEACSLAAQTDSTYGLIELLARHGRWWEAARLVAASSGLSRTEAWAPLVVRAARNAGLWRVALRVVERMTSSGLQLHYATIAELLACCAASDVPLDGIQLLLHSEAVKKPTAYLLAGLGSSVTATSRSVLGMRSATQTELLFVLLDASAASAPPSQVRDRQWKCALQLLTEHVLLCNGSPSPRVFHTTFSILRRADMWCRSLQLLQLQRSLGVSLTVKSARLVVGALPTSEWRSALLCLRGIPKGDTGVLHRVLPMVLPVRWEYTLKLLNEHRVATNTAMECIVGCEEVPLCVRLQAWARLLPSLPVSMKHRSAPVYLRLSLAVADSMGCAADSIDGMTVIERSIRGLRHDFKNYAAFVRHRAVVHRHWCDERLDPAEGVAAFRSLMEIAKKDPQCEVSAAALEQLADLVERLRS